MDTIQIIFMHIFYWFILQIFFIYIKRAIYIYTDVEENENSILLSYAPKLVFHDMPKSAHHFTLFSFIPGFIVGENPG